MKNNLRMIALGLLISAVVLFVFNQFFSVDSNAAKESKKTTTVNKNSEENSATWKAKYEKLLAKQELEKNNQDEAKRLEAQKKADEEKKKKEVKNYKLVIAKGDPSSKASEDLEKNGIVKSASDFEKFLKQNDYEKYIRDGSYDLNNKMSYEEIAKKLAHQ